MLGHPTTPSPWTNGNLTAGQSGFTAAWDWRNRLSIATSSVETVNYAYDENDKRVRIATPTTTRKNGLPRVPVAKHRLLFENVSI